MDEFYEDMNERLKYTRYCPDCNNKLWLCYANGHIWDKCFDCLEPSRCSLDLAGYITDYPVPNESMPENFEVRSFCDPIHEAFYLQHEKAYRIKN